MKKGDIKTAEFEKKLAGMDFYGEFADD